MIEQNPTLPSSSLQNSRSGFKARELPISPEQEHALARFCNTYHRRNPGTLRAYRQNITHYLGFVNASWPGLPVESMTREHAETWVQFLQAEGGYSKSIVKSMVQAARIFCTKLVDGDVLDAHPFAHVKGLPEPALKNVNILTVDDVQAMLNEAKRDRTVWGKRDRAIVACLFYGGFRRAELLAICETDIDFARDVISIQHGKGDKPREIGMDYKAMTVLEEYMSARRKHLATLSPRRRKVVADGPIWLSRRGGAIKENGLAEAIEALANRARITKAINPHAWRHAAATHDADAGMGEMEMRDKYGWSATSAMPFRYSRQTLRARTIKKSRGLRGDDGVML